MDFNTSATYPTDMDTAWQMVTASDFQRARFEELPVTLEDVQVKTLADEDVEVTTRISAKPKDLDLPAVAGKFVPESGVSLTLTETWNKADKSCVMAFDLGSLPGSVNAKSQLIAAGQKVNRNFAGQVHVSIPFLGKKVEKMIVNNLQQVVAAEESAAVRYLQHRS